MTDSKFKKIVVSVTVGAVLLLLILLSIMVYQIVSIVKNKKDIAELESKIQEFNQMIEEEADINEIRSTKDWIIRRARELDYKFVDDFPFE